MADYPAPYAELEMIPPVTPRWSARDCMRLPEIPFATPLPEMVKEVYMAMEYERQESLRKGSGLCD